VSLLRNETLRRQYERAAAITRLCDWSTVAELFVKELERVKSFISPTDYDLEERRSELGPPISTATLGR